MSVAEQDREHLTHVAAAPTAPVGQSVPSLTGPRRTDRVLLERVALGDRDAFGALYESLAPAVHGIATRVVRSPALAEEVTQEVFLAVWQQAPTFDASLGTARTWILTLAHRRAVDAVRREQSQRDRTTRSAALGHQHPFDQVAEEVLARAATESASEMVSKALMTLTPLQRKTIALAFYEGLTYPQVAERLAIPLSTAKTRIRDGLRRMAVELGGPAGGPVRAAE
ncbi:MAG: RNA polymerase sigma-70 factor [uncultured Nocardioidaceae bacterium]|uniref:RNA polymerase sigma-70 factor n=1 Tax=uncultured Nocardioidaceae bacterium TaxID=253824 RepID=A0A6J4NNZ0_9ACTN|nr:MAG: RNA polymerase sigma-70 factor [uncultured Nocardioidaceae bacterium]